MQEKLLTNFKTHLLHIKKNSSKNEHRRDIPQHIKAIYDKPTANIILNSE